MTEHRPGPMRSFRTKIAAFFAAASLLTSILMAFVMSHTWSSQMQAYALSDMQARCDTLAGSASELYEGTGAWTGAVLARVSSDMNLPDGTCTRIEDADGKVIYDDTLVVYDLHLPDGLAYVESPMESDGKPIGKLILSCKDPSVFLGTGESRMYADTSPVMFRVAVASFVMALALGYFAAAPIARPVRKLTEASERLRGGDMAARSGVDGEDELGLLGSTFDSMASALQSEMAREHSLTSDVAHELRTPIMGMLATLEAMEDGVLPCDRERVGTVSEEARRLSRLVDAMLHLSRIENGKIAVHAEETDVCRMVERLVSMHELSFEDAGIGLSYEDRCGGDATAEIDPDLIREAVTNLMSNALRYTDAGGSVVCAVSSTDDTVTVSVADTGIGMTPEESGHVFQRFWRADESRTQATGGLGVGLALTKEIVDRHSGHIGVESEKGVGSTFSITLPRAYAGDRAA